MLQCDFSGMLVAWTTSALMTARFTPHTPAAMSMMLALVAISTAVSMSAAMSMSTAMSMSGGIAAD